MDGWTDKRDRLPYFGIRLSVVHDWRFKIFTLAVQPVESHTSEQLYRFVKTVLKEFLPQDKHFLLFNTTDGAANMKKLSKLLGHGIVSPSVGFFLMNLLMVKHSVEVIKN